VRKTRVEIVVGTAKARRCPERLTRGGRYELLPIYSDCIGGLFDREFDARPKTE
jgi:hypothetical protein